MDTGECAREALRGSPIAKPPGAVPRGESRPRSPHHCSCLTPLPLAERFSSCAQISLRDGTLETKRNWKTTKQLYDETSFFEKCARLPFLPSLRLS